MTRRFLFAMAACLVSSVPVCAQAVPFAKKYALLIGVNAYDNVNFSNLYYAERDVTELAKVLREQQYEVILLSTAEGKDKASHRPTKKNIDTHIDAMLRKCTRRDLVLFGFAGHGVQIKPAAGKEKEISAYFCPMDAHPTEADSMISLNVLYGKMEDCGASVKLMLVDACRVEVKNKERFRGVDGENTPAPPKGVSVLFGCKAGQAALEDNELRHGLFFYHVLEGLRGKAKNARGDVTWQRLASHAAEAVLDAGQQQVPVLRGEVEGAPILVRIETGPTTPAKTLTTRDGIKLTFVAPGSFTRGADRITLPKGFYLGVCEITQGEYRKVTDANPSAFCPTGEGKDDVQGVATDRLPVESVSANDAIQFCKALSTREGKSFRLPTEDEWEFACRAGTSSTFHTGDTLTENRAHFNHGKSAKRRPIEVGSFPANDFGLFDMHGNVAEWCTSAKMPGKHVLRGGSWASAADKCASSNALTLPADYSNTTAGFRILCVAD